MTTVFKKLHGGETIRNASFKFRTKGGETKYLMVDSNVNFDSDGNFRHTRCFIRDDTSRQIEEATAFSELQAAQRQRLGHDKLIRRVFRDIKTPLNIIAEVLSNLSYCNPEFNYPQRQMNSLYSIIDDLAFAHKFKDGNIIQMNPVPLNISETINDIIASIEDLDVASGKQIEFDVQLDDVPPQLLVDESIKRVINVLNFATYLSFIKNIISNQVIFNLFQNAVRFSPHDKEICLVSIEVEHVPQSIPSRSGEYYSFSISNNVSEPMDIAEVQNCFHDYIHVSMMIDEESKSLSSPSGIGLGLYVAYNIVESLGGMLQCSSTENTATFSFTLLLNSAPKEETELLVRDGSAVFSIENSRKHLTKNTLHVDSFDWDQISDESRVMPRLSQNFDSFSSDSVFETDRKDTKPRMNELICPDIQRSKFKSLKLYPRVLVVDDSSLNQKMLIVALKSMTCTWDVAHNGKHAFDLLQREPCIFDIVLMDLRMPIMDGIEATKKCRQLFHLKQVPIIMMTGESDSHVVEDSLSAGANQCIKKPISKDGLIELVETWFHNRG